MQNQCYLNVRSKCILNALRIHKGIDVDHLFSKTSFIVFAEGTHDNYLKVLILVKSQMNRH